MPPLPTIANVYRVSIDWNSIGGIFPANVFHVRKASSNATAIAGFLQTAFTAGHTPNNMFRCLVSGQTATSMTILPLDGVTPGQVFSLSDCAGGAAGDFILSSAAVVSFKTGVRGSAGRGRMFCGPIAEEVCGGGLLAGGTASAMLAGWAAFLASLSGDGVDPVVASYEHATSNTITSHRIDSVLGTQRRRQDAIR